MLLDLPKHTGTRGADDPVHGAPGSQFTQRWPHTEGTAELCGLVLEVPSKDKGNGRPAADTAVLVGR